MSASARGFRLIAMQPSEDCRRLLASLMRQADNGELVGLVVTAAYSRALAADRRKQREFAVSVCGWAAQDYGLAAQMAGSCWWEIMNFIHDEREY